MYSGTFGESRSSDEIARDREFIRAQSAALRRQSERLHSYVEALREECAAARRAFRQPPRKPLSSSD